MIFTVSKFGYIVCLATFALIAYNFFDLKRHDEGTPEMVELAATIRSGSKTFLKEVYKVLAVVVVALALGYTMIQETWAGACLLFGALLVFIAEEIGMRAGTYANVRTANAARVTKALSRTIRIATLGGSVSGFSMAFGLFGFITLMLICWIQGPLNTASGMLTPNVVNNVMSARLTAYSLGFSIVAIFNRVAGGTYTKSADIGNDEVSKGEFGLEEDDPRNVCSIADLIGDCINDLAGNLTDLGESVVATYMSTCVIALQTFTYDLGLLERAVSFILVLALGGLISSVISIMYVILSNRRRYKWIPLPEAEMTQQSGVISEDVAKALKENVTRKGKHGIELRVEYSLEVDDPEAELTKATFMSAILTVIFGFIGCYLLFGKMDVAEFNWGWASPMWAALFGIVSSVVVGVLTGVYTDTKHKFVRRIAEMAKRGPSFVISKGLALGEASAFWPMILIGISICLAFIACGGFYGVAIAAVGVLSFVAETVSIDAFGPIADNAGGIAEGCGLDPEVRQITDKCDAAGNTTAAIGKGNAIGGASYSTISMFMAFIVVVPSFNLNEPITFVKLVCGMIFGGAVVSKFLSLLGDNTLAAADELTAEAERQLRIPGVLERTIKPAYNEAIRLASGNALRYMTKPSLLSVISPILAGALMGPGAQLGLLMGSTTLAIDQAFVNGNAGGAYDNGKKMIEMGMIEGAERHSPAHLASITGDMVGDIMKDVKGVNCDICIKIMAVVSVATGPLFYYYHLL